MLSYTPARAILRTARRLLVPALNSGALGFCRFYVRARWKKDAICDLVTGRAGQKRRGEAEHPWVIPAILRASAALIVRSGWSAMSVNVFCARAGRVRRLKAAVSISAMSARVTIPSGLNIPSGADIIPALTAHVA